tara:strand:+ start:549 stop:3611 length:3063 start_codon:yes stop_codon:yes gene_type:complete
VRPVAVDLGRAFWVVARTDDEGKPEVAALGGGGLYPAHIAEIQGKIVLGHHLYERTDIPPLRNLYHLLEPSEEMRGRYVERLRDHVDGGVEFYIGQKWWRGEELFGFVLKRLLEPVKRHLSPNAPLPVVGVIPPGLSDDVLYALRAAVEYAELALLSWCPTPLAAVFAAPERLQDVLVLTALIERSSLTYGIVECGEGVPQLLLSRRLDWQEDQALPLGQARQVFDEMMLLADELFAVGRDDFGRLMVWGEEPWIEHVQQLIRSQVDCVYQPFERPYLVSALGGASFSDDIQGGFLLSQIPIETPMTQIALKGYTMPESDLSVKGGVHPVEWHVDIRGHLDVPVALHADALNLLSITVESAKGRRFSKEVAIKHAKHASFQSLKMNEVSPPDESVELSHSLGCLVGIEQTYIEMFPSGTLLPSREMVEIPVGDLEENVMIVEGPLHRGETPYQWGSIAPSEWPTPLTGQGFANIQCICHSDSTVELIVQIEGPPSDDNVFRFDRKNRQLLHTDQSLQQRSATQQPDRDAMSNNTGESTQPDMEVPQELLDAAEVMERQEQQKQAHSSHHNIPQAREADLLQDDSTFSINPSAGFGGFSAEGDGSTMVLSRDSLFAGQTKKAQGSVQPRTQRSAPTPPKQQPANYELPPPSGPSTYNPDATVIASNILLQSQNQGQHTSTQRPAHNNTPPQSRNYDSSDHYHSGSGQFQALQEADSVESEDSDFVERAFAELQSPQGPPSYNDIPASQSNMELNIDQQGGHTQAIPTVERSHDVGASSPTRASRSPVRGREHSSSVSSPSLPTPQPVGLHKEDSSSTYEASEPIQKESFSRQDLISTNEREERFDSAPKHEPARRMQTPPPETRSARSESRESSAPKRVRRRAKSTSTDSSLHDLLGKLELARELADEAREIFHEVQEMSAGLEGAAEEYELFLNLTEAEDDPKALDAGDRREARKIIDIARNLSEVDQNRLPSSSRKTLIRLINDLEKRLQSDDGRVPMRLALQLANRVFETIRRDLRPW